MDRTDHYTIEELFFLYELFGSNERPLKFTSW